MFAEIRHKRDQGLKISDKVLKNVWRHTTNTSSKRKRSLKGSLVSTPGSPGPSPAEPQGTFWLWGFPWNAFLAFQSNIPCYRRYRKTYDGHRTWSKTTKTT